MTFLVDKCHLCSKPLTDLEYQTHYECIIKAISSLAKRKVKIEQMRINYGVRNEHP